jgi:peptide/nickel transport system substrate-binding protein
VLAACGGSDSTPALGGGASAGADSASGGASSLTVNLNTPPASLDPANVCNTADAISANFYSRLVQFGSKPADDGTTQVDQSKLEPDLARSWKLSEDGLTYVFKLRADARFASGKPVDAAAVKYTFERLRKLNLCSTYGIETSDTGDVLAVEAPDPQTVRIRLKKPNPALLKSWATASLGIVDPSAVRAHGGIQAGKPNEYLATHSAGSGPYVVASYEPNQKLVMEANPDYYGPAPKTSRIVVNFVTSDSTLQLQARNGSADITYGMAKLGAKQLQSDSSVKVVPYKSINTEQVVLNWAKPPLDDEQFRAALATAVPYQALVDRVAQGFAAPFDGPILPTMQYFDSELGSAHAYDVDRAKQLIAASGVKAPVSLSLNIPQGNAVEEQLATILQDAWKPLGVDVAIHKLDQAAYTDALFGNKAQASIRRDGPVVNDPDYYLGYDLQCAQPGTENTGNICIRAADAQLEKARRSLDESTRQQAYSEVVRLWKAQSPKIFLFLDEDVVVLNKAVTSFEFDPTLGTFASVAKGS